MLESFMLENQIIPVDNEVSESGFGLHFLPLLNLCF